MFSIRAVKAAMSARLYDRCTLTPEGGRFATESPWRHSLAGRIGLGTKPPPQFGQTSCSLVLTQSAQNVHSKEHIRASVASGGRSLSQYSQFGRSCKAIGVPLLCATYSVPPLPQGERGRTCFV